jgi:hypothetical protein
VKFEWGCVGLGALVTFSMLGSLWLFSRKSDDQQFSESTCHPTMNFGYNEESFVRCVQRKFGPGTPLRILHKYVSGANLILKNRSKNIQAQTEVYVAIQDDEKGPRRKKIVVQHKNGLITEISASEWSGFNGQAIPTGY